MNSDEFNILGNSQCQHNKALNVAFLGGGINSAVGKVHRTAIEMDQKFKLVAGCFSSNSDTNDKTAQEYSVESERTYKNLDELIANETGKIDAIVILTPTKQHKDEVLKCLEAKIPVICEKALVASSEEGLALKSMLQKTSGFLAVTYNYTGYPIFRELRQMIQDGKLGVVHQIQVEMPQEGFAKLNRDDSPIVPQQWRLQDEKVPTISLDLGIHLDLMVRFLVGQRPVSLVAGSNSFGQFEGIADDVWCTANYNDGLRCNLWYSKVALGYRNGLKFRVFGDKGAAEWTQEQPESLSYSDCYGQKYMIDRASPDIKLSNMERYTRFKAGHPAGFIEAFANYYSDVSDALNQYLHEGIVNENPYVFGINEALNGIYMLEAVEKSCNENCWVMLDV